MSKRFFKFAIHSFLTVVNFKGILLPLCVTLIPGRTYTLDFFSVRKCHRHPFLNMEASDLIYHAYLARGKKPEEKVFTLCLYCVSRVSYLRKRQQGHFKSLCLKENEGDSSLAVPHQREQNQHYTASSKV